MSKTRIIATLGKTCQTPEEIESVLLAGTTQIRLSPQFLTIPLEQAMHNVRIAAGCSRTNPGVYLYIRDIDLQIGKFGQDVETLEYVKGEMITIRPDRQSNGKELGCDEKEILSLV